MSADLVQLTKDTKKLTALLIEDEPEALELMENVFGKLFKKTYSATDGEEGLKLYQMYKPDVIISDIVMPNMDGIEFIKEVRDINPKQIIIMVSAANDVLRITETIQLGVNGFIHKPIEMQQLTETLSGIISNIKRRKKVETRVFSVNIPINIYERLEEDAAAEHISKTAVIVRALREFYADDYK